MSENPDVPAPVPANVPVGDSAGRPPSGAAARRRTPSYLTGDPTRWRFQMRVPVGLHPRDSLLATPRAKVTSTLGSGPRRDAERTAQKLASICEAVFAEAKRLMEQGMAMHMREPEKTLVEQVVGACKAGIDKALEKPDDALTFATALQTAQKSLTLVVEECAKGGSGMPAIVGAADTISREAIEMVLAYAKDAEKARAALAAVATIEVPAAPFSGYQPPPTATATGALLSRKPTFGHLAREYITMRTAAAGEKTRDIQTAEMRANTFFEVIGDRPIDQYTPKDLQDYVNAIQYFPSNVTKRAKFKGLSTLEIIEANRDRNLRPMKLKTLQDGFVSIVKTIASFGETTYDYRNPFSRAKLRWPKLAASTPREGIGNDVLEQVFILGVASGRLAEAMLPILALLTSRRLGLLIYLQGSDIRRKHNQWVAQTDGIVFKDGAWERVPIKTEESMTFFVLHPLLERIGFIDWARRQNGFLFEALHEHPDPPRYASKLMNRLLRKAGAAGYSEVFHSLRGDGIDVNRAARVDERGTRLQAGHAVGADEHSMYGFQALREDQVALLAQTPLPPAVRDELFTNIDFDAFAAARPKRGRPPRVEERT